MEQKKTLWIIAAVGAFLLVVLGAAGIMYSPARNPAPAIASVSPVDKGNSNGTTNPNNGWNPPPNNNSPVPNDVVVLADTATVYELHKSDSSNDGTTIDLNALKKEIISEQPAPQPQNINITVNVPEAAAPSEPKAPAQGSPAEPEPATQPKPKAEPAPVKVTAKSTSTAASTPKTTAKTTASTAVAPAPKAEPKKTQFWVQVAAYSNKKTAENARSVLDENKIPADIFTYQDNKDRLFYRVRVGPYTTKSEAEYWRAKIIKIDDFSKAESYVTSTTN